MTSVFSALTLRAALNGIVTNAPTMRTIATEGDSRSAAGNPLCWPFVYGTNASPGVLGIDNAITSSTLASLVSRVGAMQNIVVTRVAGQKIYAVIGPMGANDLAAYAGATDAVAAQNYANAMGAYIDSFSTGFDGVCLCTELPTGDATHNTRRNLLNTLYTGTTSWRATSVTIIDIASDAIMGPDASFTLNPTYWSDSTHPSTLGQARLENQAGIRAVLNALS